MDCGEEEEEVGNLKSVKILYRLFKTGDVVSATKMELLGTVPNTKVRILRNMKHETVTMLQLSCNERSR